MSTVSRECKNPTCIRVVYTAKFCSMHIRRKDPMGYSKRDKREIIDRIDGTSLVPLQLGGGYAIIDTIDKHLIEAYKFHTTKRCSVDTTINGKKVKIHHLIMGKPNNGLVIDHINRNHLDNRRSNLRMITQKLNSVNTVGAKRSSVYKGVSWNKERNKWISVIVSNRKTIHLGRYTDEIEAAKAYNAKALELWGEYAYLNDV